MELVVALGAGGTDVRTEDALSLVWGCGVGVDLTRRDLQLEAKNLRRPWGLSKGFDASAPCSALKSAHRVGNPAARQIALSVDGVTRQSSDLADQLWPVLRTGKLAMLTALN